MSPEQAVIERLLAQGAVTSLVSGRVYMLKLPQRPTLPAIRVQLIDDGTSYHLRGGSGMYRSRIQVDVYAAEASGSDPYGAAIEVADAIHGDDAGSGLSAWTGQTTGSPPDLRIHGCFFVDRQVGYDAGELREVRCRQDYMLHWSRMT